MGSMGQVRAQCGGMGVNVPPVSGEPPATPFPLGFPPSPLRAGFWLLTLGFWPPGEGFLVPCGLSPPHPLSIQGATGEVHCEKVQCPRLTCSNPIRVSPSDCCKQCPGASSSRTTRGHGLPRRRAQGAQLQSGPRSATPGMDAQTSHAPDEIGGRIMLGAAQAPSPPS